MGVASKELITAAMLACQRRLEVLGFARHEADIYTLSLAPRLFGWVALGRGVYNRGGSMVITPLVGLLHQDVERLIAACAELPYHRYYPATVQMGIWPLTPEAAPGYVYFLPEESVDEPADKVCQPIWEYAVPWMREHASLAGIQSLDRSERYRITLSTWRRAVIAYMLGDSDLARQHLNGTIARIAQEGKPNSQGILEVYRRFTAALEERMARGAWRP